jgi:hypothetical protein
VLFELATSEKPMSTVELRRALHPSTHPDPSDREVLIAIRRLALRGRIVAVPGTETRRKITYWTVREKASTPRCDPPRRPDHSG